MIYVKRDGSIIPEKVLTDATDALETLEGLRPEDRSKFIKDKHAIWGAFKPYLYKMSYEKCWYSESPEVQSFMDVDHFRPKNRAKRSKTETDPGYDWLAFSWENYRLSAERSNRWSTNEYTNETEGKNDWFPLLDGSPKSSWDNRCECDEKPILLDPTVLEDVNLLDIDDYGKVCASKDCIGPLNTRRVKESAKIYGLDLPKITGARKRVMRDINKLHNVLMKIIDFGNTFDDNADKLPVEDILEILRNKTLPNEPYAKAARSQIIRLGWGKLCLRQEEM